MPDTIEAEVLEIDGGPPVAAAPEPGAERGGAAWGSVRGRMLKLDRRWWPLWVLLGILLCGLLLAAGALFVVGLVVVRIFGSLLRLFGLGGPAGVGGGLSRTGR